MRIASLPDPPLATVDADVVLHGPGHGQVALHCQGDRHVDGAGHHDVVQAVEDVAEGVLPAEKKGEVEEVSWGGTVSAGESNVSAYESFYQ